MRHVRSLPRNLVIAGLALALLLSGWGAGRPPWAGQSAWASANVSSTAAGEDPARLKIALEVLENQAVALRKSHEASRDCGALPQARDLVEALLVLAPAGSDSYRRGEAEWRRINGHLAQCAQTGATPPSGSPAAAGTGAGSSTVVLVGGGGCVNGLIAELLMQEEAFMRDYTKRAGIELDVAALAGADRILIDVTADGGDMGSALPYPVIQAQCNTQGPGVKGLSALIFSSFLMTEQQRETWWEQVPSWIKNAVPGASPTGVAPLPWATPTPFPLGPIMPGGSVGFRTPTPAIPTGGWGNPFPVITLPPR